MLNMIECDVKSKSKSSSSIWSLILDVSK